MQKLLVITILLTVIALVNSKAPTLACYAYFETKTMEVEAVKQALKNRLALVNERKAAPKYYLLFHIARLNSYAYATKKKTVKVHAHSIYKGRKHEHGFPFYGHKTSQFKVLKASSPYEEKWARQHLQEAIKYYKLAAAHRDSDILAGVGLAWCNEQNGQKQLAVQQYRDLFRQAWNEYDMKWGGPSRRGTISMEIAKYLKRNLDPKRNKAEIEKIDEIVNYQTRHISRIPI